MCPWSPNKLWRSNSIFNLRNQSITCIVFPVIRSVADPDPESGIGKKSGSGSGMNNPDHISESLKNIFGVKILKFF
jgi:hypothetical protein